MKSIMRTSDCNRQIGVVLQVLIYDLHCISKVCGAGDIATYVMC